MATLAPQRSSRAPNECTPNCCTSIDSRSLSSRWHVNLSINSSKRVPFLSFPAQVRRSSPFIYLQCRVAFAGESLIVLIGFVSSFRLHKIIVRKRVLLNWKICMSCLYVPSSTASQFSPHLPPPLHGASSSFCLIACLVPWFIDFPPMPPRDFCIRLKAPSEFEIPRLRISI